MAVSIRLSRGGSKKRPFYNIVVANSQQRRDGCRHRACTLQSAAREHARERVRERGEQAARGEHQ